MSDDKQRSVVDGKLMALSPSLMTKFDSSSKYDCERRGYFVYVLGKKEPANFKMTRGTYLASMQEEYLKSLGTKLLIGTDEQTRWFGKLRTHLDKHIASGRVVGVEATMPSDFRIAGVPISSMSRADIVLDGPPEIEDLKTTGNIEKNGKTEAQVKKDIQLHTYRKAFFPDADEVRLTLNYLQVEGALVLRPVSVSVSKVELDRHFETVIVPLVERIKSVVAEKDVKKVTADRRKCWNCPHRSYCPPDKENPLMNIFEKFAKKPASATAAAPAAGTTPAPAAILPKDAPRSDPAKAAAPVAGFQAVPPPKTEAEKAARRKMTIVDVPATPASGQVAGVNYTRPEGLEDEEWAAMLEKREKKALEALAAKEAEEKQAAKEAQEAAVREQEAADNAADNASTEEKKNKGGRPPGAKNKPKLDGEETTEVSYGVTINVGDFNSVRIDVRRSKRHGADQADEVYQSLLDEVKEKVQAEMAKVAEGKPS